jgi:hypothetical protein
MTISDYLLREPLREEMPTLRELVARIRERKLVRLRGDTGAIIREERACRERQLVTRSERRKS